MEGHGLSLRRISCRFEMHLSGKLASVLSEEYKYVYSIRMANVN